MEEHAEILNATARSAAAFRSPAFSAHVLPVEGGGPRETHRILVADDDRMSRRILEAYLTKLGHVVVTAEDGLAALRVMELQRYGQHENRVDLILLDLDMPRLNGYSVLERLKEDPDWRQVPVIVISTVSETSSIVRCVQLGADDYFYKPFDPVLLQARVGACLERRRFFRALLETQERLSLELTEAAQYVQSLLPAPVDKGPVRIAWSFQPSTQLGGDGFGYHWLDRNRLAIYLLDVCGHGVGAALLSVTTLNIIRSQSIPNVDFGSPSEVLTGLNRTFPRGSHAGRFTTVWYGVYDLPSRSLVFASAGHPPALLAGRGAREFAKLMSGGSAIGIDGDAEYATKRAFAEPGSYLYLFSDGCFEYRLPSGYYGTFEDILDLIPPPLECPSVEAKRFLQAIRAHSVSETFDDDCSLMLLCFE